MNINISIEYEGEAAEIAYLIKSIGSVFSQPAPAEEDESTDIENSEAADEEEEEEDGDDKEATGDPWQGYVDAKYIAEALGIKTGSLYSRITNGTFPQEDAYIDNRKAWLDETAREAIDNIERKKSRFELDEEEEDDNGDPKEIDFS